MISFWSSKGIKTIYMKVRPYFHEFIELVKDDWEIVIFTASQKCYADAILDRLDRHGVLSKRYGIVLSETFLMFVHVHADFTGILAFDKTINM